MEKLLIWLVLIGFGGLVWAVLTDRYEVARNVAKLSVTGAAALGLILLMALVIPSSWAWADAVGLVVLAVLRSTSVGAAGALMSSAWWKRWGERLPSRQTAVFR